MSLFKKSKNIPHKKLLEVVLLCGALALLLLAAALISTGAGKNLLADSGISPHSQTAFFGFGCDNWDPCWIDVNFTSLYASPNPVPYGQSTTINWSSPHADTCRVYLLTGYTAVDSGDYTPYNYGVPDSGAGGAVILAQNYGYTDSSGTFYSPNYSLVYTTPNTTLAHNGSWATPALTATPQYGYYVDCANYGGADYGDSGYHAVNITVSPQAPSCSNGLPIGTYPSCSCPANYTQTGTSCVALTCPSGYTGSYPSCTAPAVTPPDATPLCPAGYTGTYPNCIPPPTSTTLDSFIASPASIANGASSLLSWNGTMGTNFFSCALGGGEYTTGVWFDALPGSTATSPLSATTAYSMACYDTTYGWTSWLSTLVTVTPAPIVDLCSNIDGAQSAIPANGHANGDGTCSPNAGYTTPPGGGGPPYFVTADVCSNISGIQTNAPSNTHENGDGTCSANAGYVLTGDTVTQADVCSNIPGLQTTAPANGITNGTTCSCNSGYTLIGGSCIIDGVINSLTANPSRVRKDSPVSLSWSTSHMSTCTLSGLTSAGTATVSTLLSSPSLTRTITSKTIFTLSCSDATGADYSSSVTVNLVPEYIDR